MPEARVLDPATRSDSGSWTIVAGRGTRDLAQTSGAGTADSATGATGSIRCS
jgi:hypothetical protein